MATRFAARLSRIRSWRGIPVVLMSGVVNKSVADKAVAVKADELIRKPFQPQELIGRVKTLLAPKDAPVAPRERPGSSALQNLFAPPTPVVAAPVAPVPQAVPVHPPRHMKCRWRLRGRAHLRRPSRRCCNLNLLACHRISRSNHGTQGQSPARHKFRPHNPRLPTSCKHRQLRRKSRNCAERLRVWNCWLENCRANCNWSANITPRLNNKYAH